MKPVAWAALGLSLTLVARPGLAQEPPRFKEDVEVSRVLVIARVIDGQGRPILGLTPADFDVRVGKRRLRVESAHWVQEAPPGGPESVAATALVPEAPAVEGRLIVIFFQKSFERWRLPGLMRMRSYAQGFLDALGPKDRVAVLSFDSHLRLWLDFTSDRAKIREIMDGWLRSEDRPVAAADGPSIARHLDYAEARHAATPEEALSVTAEALGRIPGPKSLLLFGWGWGWAGGGRGSPSGLVDVASAAVADARRDRDYAEARRALVEAKVTVFALDVTDADWHTFEVGLQQVAADTGGFYSRTHVFPSQAMARLSGALAGYYILSFEKPGLPPGDHKVSVELIGREGHVLARMDSGR